jgi:hypothetical protein
MSKPSTTRNFKLHGDVQIYIDDATGKFGAYIGGTYTQRAKLSDLEKILDGSVKAVRAFNFDRFEPYAPKEIKIVRIEPDGRFRTDKRLLLDQYGSQVPFVWSDDVVTKLRDLDQRHKTALQAFKKEFDQIMRGAKKVEREDLGQKTKKKR